MEQDNRLKQYNVEIVMCIDATASMTGIIDTVKENAMHMYGDICKEIINHNRVAKNFRIKVITFRDFMDYMASNNDKERIPFTETKFFDVKKNEKFIDSELKAFCNEVDSIVPFAGGDLPEDGLEALACAIHSDWLPLETGVASRKIIILWTDAPTHILPGDASYNLQNLLGAVKSYKKKAKADCFPKILNEDFSFVNLTEWWGDSQSENACIDYESKRLLLYAPAEPHWTDVANWSNVVHIEVTPNEWAQMNNFQRTEEYNEIIQLLVHTLVGF